MGRDSTIVCLCVDEEGVGVGACLPGTVPSETALSSLRNNRRHDSHTVPLQQANCVQHVRVVAAPRPQPALFFMTALTVKGGDVVLRLQSCWSEIANTI